MPTLIDPTGQPLAVPRKALSGEIAAPTPYNRMGWRTVWHPSLSRGLSPARLAQILEAADAGNPYEFLTLADDMETRDPHYASVLGTRKRAILGLDRKVESATDKLRDRKIADRVRELIAAPKFGGLLAALLDALGKGYSAVEMDWDTASRPWTPRAYTWRDPRWFLLDRTNGTQLRLIDEIDLVNGIELPPGRFIIHRPNLKMGLPIRGGLARLAAIYSLARHIVMEAWLSFSESYGSPTRIAKADDRFFQPGAGAEAGVFIADLQSKLQTMLGQDAYAVFPKSVETTLQQAALGGANVYMELCDYLQKMVSKGILGRSDAADSTPGSLGGQESAILVRQDILESDTEELQNTINDQLVAPFVALNFGPQAEMPRFQFHFQKVDNLGVLVTALKELVPLGLEVEQSVVRDKLNIPDPLDGAELLQPPTVTPTAPPAAPVPEVPEPEAETETEPEQDTAAQRALNQSQLAKGVDPTAALSDRLATEAEPLLQSLLEPIRAALNSSKTLMEFRATLLTLYPKLDAKEFAELMGQSLVVAEAKGFWDSGHGD